MYSTAVMDESVDSLVPDGPIVDLCRLNTHLSVLQEDIFILLDDLSVLEKDLFVFDPLIHSS